MGGEAFSREEGEGLAVCGKPKHPPARDPLIELYLSVKEQKHSNLTRKINYTVEIAKLMNATLLKSVFT